MRRLLLLAVVGLVSCSSPSAPTGVATYRIGGDANSRVSVTYTVPVGTTSPAQPTTVTVPWTFTVGSVKDGEFLQVRAQLLSAGTVQVTIEKNGTICQNQTVSGVGAVASIGCVF